MLQINCPHCKSVIKSPFLAEMSSVECNQCKQVVPVANVFIKTRGFTMHRDDLLNRIFRYRSLLREVEKERQLLQKEKNVSPATLRSLEQFYVTLQELLAGARNNFRLPIKFDLFTDIEYGGRKIKGKLTNISCQGISIELDAAAVVPRKNHEVRFPLALPVFDQPRSVTGKVVWVRAPESAPKISRASVGLAFTNLDERTRASIWDYILQTENG